MQSPSGIWATPLAHLTQSRPDHPVIYLSPQALHATAQRFLTGFPGLVTYAVKANPHPAVLDNLVAAGLRAFDVASPAEMQAVRAACPEAVLHYNNPVRSDDEIAAGIAMGVASWSIDCPMELERLANVPRSAEIAVRFKLPVKGASYDFGEKFGATPEIATDLLQRVAQMGFTPSLCFHPGTQCEDPQAWAAYIHAAAQISRSAGVPIQRLNVGGGFPVARSTRDMGISAIFAAIDTATRAAFGDAPPTLICEPGRAMIGDAMVLATRVKALRADGTLFLNDGHYGALADLKDSGLTARIACHAPDGTARRGPPTPRVVFGPTCDSLDRLPDGLCLPADLAPGDYVLFGGMGAYSFSLTTGFNGYGLRDLQIVLDLSGL